MGIGLFAGLALLRVSEHKRFQLSNLQPFLAAMTLQQLGPLYLPVRPRGILGFVERLPGVVLGTGPPTLTATLTHASLLSSSRRDGCARLCQA